MDVAPRPRSLSFFYSSGFKWCLGASLYLFCYFFSIFCFDSFFLTFLALLDSYHHHSLIPLSSTNCFLLPCHLTYNRSWKHTSKCSKTLKIKRFCFNRLLPMHNFDPLSSNIHNLIYFIPKSLIINSTQVSKVDNLVSKLFKLLNLTLDSY